MNQIDRLPFEIFNQILTEFVNDLYAMNRGPYGATLSEPYLDDPSYTELINLRLVSKRWSKAVLQFYFETIEIDDWERAELIINNWKEDLYIPQFRCPVKRLRVQELWHTHAERCEVPSEDRSSGWPTIEQVVTLINLLGQNLKTLVITLRCCLKVSPELIKAIKTIQDLKSLTISFEYERSEGTYDLDSLSELFFVIPRIDHLSLHGEPLARLNLKPPALSNLRYFYFTYGKNVKGISKITQASKNTLKFIEIDTDIGANNPPPEGLRQVFEPIKDTLEGLFVYNIPGQLGDNVTDMDFPSLRVVGTQCMFHLIRAERYRLQAPMFKNVRTIVAGLIYGEDYWQRAFKLADVDTLKKVIRFKHIVFTLEEESEHQEIDPEVVEAFESYGVQCHLTDELSSDEILELDLELNGPLETSN